MITSKVQDSIDNSAFFMALYEQEEVRHPLPKLAELDRRAHLSDTYFDYDGYSFCYEAELSLMQRIEQWSRPSSEAYEDCVAY